MKKLLLTTLLLLFSLPSYAIDVIGDTEATEYSLVTLTLKDKVDDVVWEVDYINDLTRVVPGKKLSDKDDKGNIISSFIFTGPPGVYKVRTWTVASNKLDHATTLVRINPIKPPQPPIPPIPPNPDPNPPTPQDNPIPISSPGLRVLILYDSQQLGKASQQQVAMLYDPTLRTYLSQNCAVVNGVPEGRYWSKGVNIVNESDSLKQMMTQAKPTSYPWLVVANGTSSYQGPIGLDVKSNDLISIIDKYKLPK